jgi:hypothetical protein
MEAREEARGKSARQKMGEMGRGWGDKQTGAKR